MTDTPDTEPTALGDPLEPMTDAEIVRYARGVVTNKYMWADANDQDWAMSLFLILCNWKPLPANASTLFLVPMAEHAGGRWLNGRVPGVTMSAVCVPMESVNALVAKVKEFDAALHPEEATADDGPG
jgi:hypothetical protein